MSNYSVRLNGIGIENFKAFGKYQHFELAPITVITGPNNSGKSALVAALELLSTNDIFSHLDFHSPGLEIGELSQVINKSSKLQALIFSLDYKISVRKQQDLSDLYSKEQLDKIYSQHPGSTHIPMRYLDADSLKIELYYDNEKARLIGLYIFIQNEQCVFINLRHSFCQINYKYFEKIYNFKGKIFKADQYERFPQLNEIESLIRESLCEPTPFNETDSASMSYQSEDKSLRKLEHILFRITEPLQTLNWWDEDTNSEIRYRFGGIFEKFGFKGLNDVPLHSAEFLLFLNTIRKNVIELLIGSNYEIQNTLKLEAQRASKQRVYLYQEKNIPLTRDIINAAESEMIVYESNSENVKDFLKRWTGEEGFKLFEDFKFEHIPGVGYRFLALKDGDWRELPDLGYGTRQVIPVILAIWGHIQHYPSIRKILMIEEPESNLHPKLQSLLADLFVEAKHRSIKPLIIETHSEYLIRKLQYLVAKKKISPDKIAIHYIGENNSGGEKDVFEIKIDEQGILSKEFGTGFFDEALNWEIELLRIKNTQMN